MYFEEICASLYKGYKRNQGIKFAPTPDPNRVRTTSDYL